MATDLKGFWTGGLTNVKDPKRNFRFKVSFLGTGDTGSPLTDGGIWYAKSCTQPSVTMTESVHDFMIHKFYWPAKAEWNEVDMVLVDPVEPDSSSNLLSILDAAGFKIPANAGSTEAFSSMSKAGSTAALGNILIQQLDAEGNTNHEWTLVHAWAKEVSFSNLDYTSEDLMEINFKVRYDWAEFAAPGALGTRKLFSV